MEPANNYSQKHWYTKISNGVLEGPFTLQELQDMLQNKVLGDTAQISKDKENWLEIQSVDIFKQEWMAAMPDNNDYGPFSLAEIPELLVQKKVAMDTQITNPMTGEEITVSNALKRVEDFPQSAGQKKLETGLLFPEFVLAKNQVPKLSSNDPDKKDRNQTRIQNLELRIKQLEKALSTAHAQLELTKKGQKEQSIAQQQHISSSEQRIRELSNTLDQVRREKEKLIEQLNVLRNQENVRLSREATLQKELSQATAKIDNLMRQLQAEQQERRKIKDEAERTIKAATAQLEQQKRELQEKYTRYEQAQQQITKLQTQLSQERHDAMHKENVFREKIKSLEKELSTTKTTLQSTMQKLDAATHLAQPQRVQSARLEKELAHSQELAAQFKLEAEKEITFLKKEIDSLSAEKAALTKQLQDAFQAHQSHVELNKQELVKLQNEIVALKSKSEELEKAIALKEQELKDKTTAFEKEKTSLNKMISEMQSFADDHKRLMEILPQIEGLKKENSALQGELEKYKVLNEQNSDEYKKREMEFTAKIKLLEADNAALRMALKTAQQAPDAVRKAEEMRQQLESARLFSVKLEEELKALRANYQNLQGQYQRLEKDHHLEVNQLKETLRKLNEELEVERNRSGALQNKLDASSAELETFRKELELAREQEKTLKLSYEAQENALKRHMLELERKIEASQAEMAAFKKSSIELQNAKDKALGQLELVQKELTEINRSYTSLKLESAKRETDLSLKIKELESAISQTQSSNMALQNELVQERQKNNQLSIKLQQHEKINSRLKELENQNKMLIKQLEEKETELKLQAVIASQQKVEQENNAALVYSENVNKVLPDKSIEFTERLVEKPDGQRIETLKRQHKPSHQATSNTHNQLIWNVVMGCIAIVMFSVIVVIYFSAKAPLDTQFAYNKEPATAEPALQQIPKDNFIRNETIRPGKDETILQSQSLVTGSSMIAKSEEKDIKLETKEKKLPAFDVAGIKVIDKESGKLLIFEEPLFKKRAELSEVGIRLLAAFAEEVKPFVSELKFEIIGHTDSDPLPPTSPFKNNKELSMMRADVAAQFIKKAIGGGNLNITVMGSGSENPPYPEDTPENKARNRTVSISVLWK